jgi:hypothetical protein
VFVGVVDGDLADHDVRLRGGATERLLGHNDHAHAISATFLVVVGVLLGGSGLGDQDL